MDPRTDASKSAASARLAINGLGRIGRSTLKIIHETPELELVAANDLVSSDNLAYLIRYDSVYGRYPHRVDTNSDGLVVDGKPIRLFSERDPARLPWRELEIDLVFECTGRFRESRDLAKHLEAGARFVILSAPPKDESTGVVVHGVNLPDGNHRMVSCASCTTNSIAPLVEALQRRIGIERAVMTTVHAYTSSQHLIDGESKDFRRGRAGAANLVPASTGAALATTRAVPELRDRFDGVAIRVPVAIGSIADVVLVTSRSTSAEEINRILTEEAASERYRGILGVSEDPIVSSDIIGDPRASVIDLEMTRVVDGTLVKVMAWYDNEWGFTHQMVREAKALLAARPAAAVRGR